MSGYIPDRGRNLASRPHITIMYQLVASMGCQIPPAIGYTIDQYTALTVIAGLDGEGTLSVNAGPLV